MCNPLKGADPDFIGFLVAVMFVGSLIGVGCFISSLQGCHQADVAMENGYEQVVEGNNILWKKADNAN